MTASSAGPRSSSQSGTSPKRSDGSASRASVNTEREMSRVVTTKYAAHARTPRNFAPSSTTDHPSPGAGPTSESTTNDAPSAIPAATSRCTWVRRISLTNVPTHAMSDIPMSACPSAFGSPSSPGNNTAWNWRRSSTRSSVPTPAPAIRNFRADHRPPRLHSHAPANAAATAMVHARMPRFEIRPVYQRAPTTNAGSMSMAPARSWVCAATPPMMAIPTPHAMRSGTASRIVDRNVRVVRRSSPAMSLHRHERGRG